MMTDFCSVDRRLLATGYVPFMRFRARRLQATAKEAIALGAKAILDRLALARKGHSPSHIGFDPVWSPGARKPGMPILFHVGGEDPKLNPDLLSRTACRG